MKTQQKGSAEMNSLSDGIRDALSYIEDNLADDLKIEDIAARAYLSPFYFQKLFHVLCGITAGEYIRNRRLACAAQELSAGNAKVMDVALKYGYESADSFAKAFTKFHGITPSAAKESGARIKSYAPLRIRLSLEGGNMLEYKIVEKAAFTVVGISRPFNCETSYSEIPKFWEEFMNGDKKGLCGMFGLCVDVNGKNFDYLIADVYKPWEEIPEGCVTKSIEGGLWAVFPCGGALPKSLQYVNTQVWSDWLPNLKGYKLGGNYNFEFYTPDPNYSEIWVPLVKE